ncbi:MAG: carbon monoxide dehydrogenase subunit G [Dehalococcoidia bacterium]|nr:carbon monoxide dehydrogenase subunit G [Dehalococcoidia bacterium]
MDVSGEHRFKAPRALVWEMLLDPVALEAAMPGCEQFVPTGPAGYDVTIRVGVAAVKGTYSGNVQVQDRNEGKSYRLVVSGSGRPGSLQGDALLTLSDDGPESTLVRYQGDVRAQGAIARLGSRLLGGTAQLLIGQFFKSMERQVDARAV